MPALRPPRYPGDWMYCALDCGEVGALIDRRRSLLADPTPTSDAGRILCVVGDLDTAMGEGTVESNGIIDDAYLPPWDTWFACVHGGDHTLLRTPLSAVKCPARRCRPTCSRPGPEGPAHARDRSE